MSGRADERRSTSGTSTPVPLTSLLETWVADELITPEQADRILVRGDVLVQEQPAAPERRHERSSLVVEALGYLGGVIILVASGLIASLYWDQVTTTARLLIVGGVTAVLLAAGFAIPQRLDDVGTRLRSVLWLLSTGAFAAFLGLLGADALDLAGEDVFIVVSGGLAAYATCLWLVGRTLVQQLAMMASLLLTSAALANRLADSDVLPGVAVWGVSLVWVLLGRAGRLEPQRLVMAFGAAGMFVGTLMAMPTTAGIALALVTAVSVVATAVLLRDLLLLAVGALGTLMVLPSAVVELFPGTLAAPIAMLAVGALLVLAGLSLARRRSP